MAEVPLAPPARYCPVMSGSGRHEADDVLAAHLATGSRIIDAAAVGMNERTVRRRLADPDFRTLLDGLKAEAVGTAVARLSADMVNAAAALAGLLDSSDERVRLSAGRAVLEIGIKARQAEELEQRVHDLTEGLERLTAKEDGRGKLARPRQVGRKSRRNGGRAKGDGRRAGVPDFLVTAHAGADVCRRMDGGRRQV